MNPFSYLWGSLLIFGLVVEGIALFNTRRKDTLSEQVWFLRTKWWGRVTLMPFFAWMTYHFWLEPSSLDSTSGRWLDDVALILVFVGVGFLKTYQERQDV